MNHRGCADGTGGTQRMAQRNRTAHRVDGREGLRRERFVDFKQVIRKLSLSRSSYPFVVTDRAKLSAVAGEDRLRAVFFGC